MVSQQISQAQYREAGPLMEELLTQVREVYRGVVSKLKVTILSEEQASEEDATLLGTTKEFLARMLQKVILIRTKRVEKMPQPKQAAGPGAARGPGETQTGQEDEAVRASPERKALRLDPLVPQLWERSWKE